jgi:hypothetical protein
MKRVLWAMLVLSLTGVRAWAGSADVPNDQAFLAILAETKVQRMAGMPEMPQMPAGLDLSKIPGMGRHAMPSGGPERKLEVRLWSPGIAPDNAFAKLAPPAGLLQGKVLDLALYRPKPEEGTTATGPGGTDFETRMKDFTIKIYWGSSPTVRKGQPKVIRWGGMDVSQQAEMRKQAEAMQKRSSYFYKPDWTTGYWPTDRQPGKISPKASLVGHYALTTSYTGNVEIDAPTDVNFLDPIALLTPDLTQQPSLEQALAFTWKPIPYVLGLHARIIGMEGQTTLIIWTSSEIYTAGAMGDWDYLQMADVRKMVGETVMMKGDRIDVTVPAGIFRNADMAMMSMVGYGPGAALAVGQPLPRIQTKTTLSLMLGGKSMQGMGGMGQVPPGDEE